MNAAALPIPVERQAAPPPALLALQSAFALIVREPFAFDTGRMRCRTDRYAASVVDALKSRGRQGPAERVSIYNEQYWFRLLTVLQDEYPLLSAVMGYWEFNRLATEYLDANPSRQPYLEGLPWGLPDFLRARSPQAPVRLLQCAALDLASFRAFHAPGREPLDPRRLEPDAAERLASSCLELQPWLSLVQEDENLADTRRLILEGSGPADGMSDGAAIGAAHGASDSVPDGSQAVRGIHGSKGYWAVFRRDDVVAWLSLSAPRYALLRLLSAGDSLEAACEEAGAELPCAEGEAFAASLGPAFAEWTARGWFVHPGAI